MGDTAVAVNPADPRYAALIGQHVRRPLPSENQIAIPIVGDESVDFEFGTGVLKVTPAHDKTDYEIGQRHNLATIDVLNPDGTMNELAGLDFVGLDRFEARKKAALALADRDLLVKEEPYQNTVGFSERAGVPIEPRLSEQWFLRYPKTAEARDTVRNHLIRFFPERWEKVYDHWLENIQDWCISRQLWWGHRIPVWTKGADSLVQTDSPGDDWTQDPDVLDTWFSSWLWAHETMDDPARAKFYPTSVLVTGPDIIFFWVARMIMAGLEYTGEIPFRDVYFTGIIRDKGGKKMSKSLGNSPDPLDLIAKFGADGLRFGLMRIAPAGQDIKFDELQIVEGRNFCNKFWNACRFRLLQGPIDPAATPDPATLSIFARDLLAKLDATIDRIEHGYATYRFSDIAQALYDFIWGDFCDRFIEAAKSDFTSDDPIRRAGTLAAIDVTIRRVLVLLHPYAPFLTEELWHGLGFGTETIQFEPWPTKTDLGDPTSTRQAADFYESIAAARTLRATFNLPSSQKLPWRIRPSVSWLEPELPALATLLNARTLDLETTDAPSGMAVAATAIGEIFLPLEGLVDPSNERERLTGEINKVKAELEKVARKLSSEKFVANAPTEVITEHRDRQKSWADRLKTLEQARNALG